MPGDRWQGTSRQHPATVTLLMSTLIIRVTGVNLPTPWPTENKFLWLR